MQCDSPFFPAYGQLCGGLGNIKSTQRREFVQYPTRSLTMPIEPTPLTARAFVLRLAARLIGGVSGKTIMTGTNSRILFALESVILSLPLTALFVFGVPTIVHVSIHDLSAWNPFFSVAQIIIAGVCLTAFWILSYRFLRYGSTALGQTHRAIWILVYCGIVFSVLGAPSFVSLDLGGNYFRFGAFGLALFPPVLHLLIEARKIPLTFFSSRRRETTQALRGRVSGRRGSKSR